MAYSMCCEGRRGPLVRINDFEAAGSETGAHHGFIVEDNTFAGAEGGGSSGEVVEDEERLAAHFLGLEGDYVDEAAIGREESEELATELFLVDLVVEVLDVERGVGLRHGGGRRGYTAQ